MHPCDSLSTWSIATSSESGCGYRAERLCVVEFAMAHNTTTLGRLATSYTSGILISRTKSFESERSTFNSNGSERFGWIEGSTYRAR